MSEHCRWWRLCVKPELDTLRQELVALQNARQIVEGALARERAALASERADANELRRTLRFRQQAAADVLGEQQVLAALVLVDETTPLWRALHRLIDLLQQDQQDAVCRPNLNSEQRHFNAGRLSMCEDLRDTLNQKWTEARRQNREARL